MKYHDDWDADTEPNPGGCSSLGKFGEKHGRDGGEEERRTSTQEIAPT